MKNILISFTVFVFMLAAIIFSIAYLNKITKNIQTINDNLETYITNEDWDNAYKASLEYTSVWEKHTKIIKAFVNHQEIDNVEIELWKLPQYVKEHSKDEALASVHVLKFLISHISNMEKINLQNIF